MTDSLERAVGRIEGKLDRVLMEMLAHSQADDRRFATIGADVEALKGWKAWMIGAGAAAGAAVGLVFKIAPLAARLLGVS